MRLQAVQNPKNDKYLGNSNTKASKPLLVNCIDVFLRRVHRLIFQDYGGGGVDATKFSSNVPVLVVIGGATATGKTGLAIALAERLNAVVLSADSRQVYRELDIGTAKPSVQEQRQVPHYLIDVCDPTETLTVAEYQQAAQSLIAQVHAAGGVVPLLVGGTGLYINSVVRGLRIPPVSPQVELRSQLAALGQAHCHALLKQVDPPSSGRIHPHDQVRTLRALEVFYVTGKPLSLQQGEHPPPYPILYLGLACSTVDGLRQRIDRRTQIMITQGFVAEVIDIRSRYGDDLPLLKTLGYAEMMQHLKGEIGLEDAIALTSLHTRQFAKRQGTWFRNAAAVEWFDADDPYLVDQVWARLQQFLQQVG